MNIESEALLTQGYVWVIGFTGSVENYKKFIRCAKNNAAFYVEDYRSEGLETEIFTDDELDDLCVSKANDLVASGKFKR